MFIEYLAGFTCSPAEQQTAIAVRVGILIAAGVLGFFATKIKNKILSAILFVSVIVGALGGFFITLIAFMGC